MELSMKYQYDLLRNDRVVVEIYNIIVVIWKNKCQKYEFE